MSANNISELKMSNDDIMQNLPSEIDLMHEVFEDLQGNKAKILESHSLAGSMLEIQRCPAGDSLVLQEEPSTTDCMLQEVFSEFRTNLPIPLENDEPAGLPLMKRCNSMPNMTVLQTSAVDEDHVSMDAQLTNSSTLEDGSPAGPVPTTIASYESPTFSYYIGFMSAAPAVTPAASEKCENELDSSTALVQPAVSDIIHDLEGSLPRGRAVSMPNIAIEFDEIESIGSMTKRSESVNSLEPIADVDRRNAGTEATITSVSARRRRSLWSRTKKFVRRLFCCSANNMPLD